MKSLMLLSVSLSLARASSLQERDCSHDNCLRAVIQSGSEFCSAYTATPTITSLPTWATACTSPSTTSQILSACSCLPTPTSTPRIPTIWLAGDSTEAPGGGHNGTEGWGQYLQYSFPPSVAFVNNSAYAGRSARSFTREGRFEAIAEKVKPGDWVVIEFGHNDGGSPYPAADDNGRADCPGAGNQTCPTVYANVSEIVLTYPTYLKDASEMYLSLGAKVILSSPTPDNPWETGNYSYTPDRFTYYSWLSVTELGGPSAGVYFVPHGQYAAQAMKNLGPEIVDANYPMDHTHTAPYLADVVAQSFVLGLKCGTSGLGGLVSNATARLEGSVLGTCILANGTLPI
ncbi:SGNH hydrolase [Mollisia scopiformis]|uniref:SGNH hydrolase n=1 Tax=Mollisia scopiformis TaxID=149040 RepID=A0A194XLX1_MOLSC|nr:SGNH hydrolase [Mollisia scopiformis]KUJ21178.1 SGNH hydrolase [Mollisia scopiformis]